MPEQKIDYTMWMMNDVMPDELMGYQLLDIQAFLESRKTFLATYKIDAVPYSIWLDQKCQEKDLNPKHILVNLQKEQSLIDNAPTLPNQRTLNRALGYGMEDDGDRPEFYGFQRQNECAIKDIVRDYKKYKAQKIQPKQKVDEGLLILQPFTAFTSVLYEYTPWTGTPESIFYAKFKGIHGVYLFWYIWKKYWTADLQQYQHITDVERFKRKGFLDNFLNGKG